VENYAVTPKAAALVQERKSSASSSTASVYTYHGDLGILDSQRIFDTEVEDWSAIFELETGVTGKPTVINRIAVKNKLKTVSNVIQFRVFCAAYCRAYVGNVGTDENSERESNY